MNLRSLTLGILAIASLSVAHSVEPDGGTWSMTLVPGATLRYRGEGKILPQGYVNRTEKQRAPLYRLEWRQKADPSGYWGFALWHTGVFGGGAYRPESVPDVAGGDYQTDLLNVGFTNLFVTYHRPLESWPVEAEVGFSIAREIFKRKEFVVQGIAAPNGLDDVNEISAEGFGVGLSGIHGGPVYVRWRAAAHYYVQLFDAKTDASAGQIFQSEAGLGWRRGRFSVETGALWQAWFILGQGNRRLSVPGTPGAVISYNRQDTRLGGLYLKIENRF